MENTPKHKSPTPTPETSDPTKDIRSTTNSQALLALRNAKLKTLLQGTGAQVRCFVLNTLDPLDNLASLNLTAFSPDDLAKWLQELLEPALRRWIKEEQVYNTPAQCFLSYADKQEPHVTVTIKGTSFTTTILASFFNLHGETEQKRFAQIMMKAHDKHPILQALADSRFNRVTAIHFRILKEMLESNPSEFDSCADLDSLIQKLQNHAIQKIKSHPNYQSLEAWDMRSIREFDADFPQNTLHQVMILFEVSASSSRGEAYDKLGEKIYKTTRTNLGPKTLLRQKISSQNPLDSTCEIN